MNFHRSICANRSAAILAFVFLCTASIGGCVGSTSGTIEKTQTPPAATASFNVSSLTFGSQSVGTSSAAQTVTLMNSGTAALTITSIAVAGTNKSDFAQTNTCSSSVAASGKCAITVKFAPTGAGTRTATLTISDNATGSPQSVALSGTASAAIAISVSPAVASILAGATQSLKAVVQNDAQNEGVTWSIAGTTCSGATCGTLSATSSASGAAINYQAPASVSAATTVMVTATAKADTTKTASAAITVTPAPLPIVVAVAPMTASVQAGASASFTAAVSNDAQNEGVVWALSGTGCSGATCGTLSAPSSLSGILISYAAPTTVPNPASVTLTATSVADGTKSAAAAITVTSAAATTPVDLGALSSPLMGVDVNNNIDIVATDATNAVQFHRSANAGGTFSHTQVAAVPNPPVGVQMALDSQGHITLFWEDWQMALADVSVSADGTTFSTPSFIPGAPAACGLAPCMQDPGQYPQLSVTPGGVINVAYTGGPQQGEIQSAQSVNGGTSFTTSVAASFNASNLVNVAGSQGQEYLFWGAPDGDIFFSGSTDGKTFSAVATLSADTVSFNPRAFMDASGNIYVTWRKGTTATDPNNELMFTRSADQGSTFSTPVAVFTTTEFIVPDQEQVVVEASGVIDVVVNADAGGSEGKILFARSVDHGATFSSAVTLAPDGGFPTIRIDSCGGINAVWNSGETLGGNDIFLSRSTDGSTFSTPTNLSNNQAMQTSFAPQIATDALGHTLVIWQGGAGTNDLFFVVAGTCHP